VRGKEKAKIVFEIYAEHQPTKLRFLPHLLTAKKISPQIRRARAYGQSCVRTPTNHIAVVPQTVQQIAEHNRDLLRDLREAIEDEDAIEIASIIDKLDQNNDKLLQIDQKELFPPTS
jgi:hypothetical protein